MDKLTREQIAAMTLDRLRLAVAELMEPKPPVQDVKVLRTLFRQDWRYSSCDLRSSGDWWCVDIGTSAPQFPEWKPLHCPDEEIEFGWWVHKNMLEGSALRHNRYLDFLKDVISARTGQCVLTWTMVIDLMEPVDFCRAALMAVS